MSLFKSAIAPKGLEFGASDIVVSGKYMTILTCVSYPRSIGVGYLSNITNMPGVKIVVKHIPVPFSTLSKMLNKELASLRNRYSEEKDRTTQERLRQDYDTLEEFVQQLAAANSKIFDFQMHLVLSADSKEDLEVRKIQVKNYLTAMGLRAVPLRFEMEKVLKSILPFFPKQDIEDRIGTIIPSPTMAGMYPFIFDSLKDPGPSTLLGTDFSGGVVLFNQFFYQVKGDHSRDNRNNANMIILGTSGSGKSTAAKLLVRSSLRNSYQVVAIDPENELREMVELFGGDAIDLGKGGQFGLINPLEVLIDADEDEVKEGLGYTVLTKTLQFLKAFMKYYDPSIEEDVLNVFIEMVQETYRRFGIDFNTDFSVYQSENYPTFDDVYTTIKSKLISMTDMTHERDVMERLELKIRPFTNELRFYFNGHTTIHPNSNFIAFNIRELMNADVNVRNALFFNILKFAWSLCLDSSINTVMMVDEAHVLLSGGNVLGADFLAQMQRRSRKYNTGNIIITQQPSDFTPSSVITQGKAIFDNAAYYLVMGLKKQAVEDLALLIDLNDNEKESIKRYSQGDALFVCGNRRMRMSVILTQEELESFGSGGGL